MRVVSRTRLAPDAGRETTGEALRCGVWRSGIRCLIGSCVIVSSVRGARCAQVVVSFMRRANARAIVNKAIGGCPSRNTDETPPRQLGPALRLRCGAVGDR